MLLRRGHRRGCRRDSSLGDRVDTLGNLQSLQLRGGHPRDVFQATDSAARAKRVHLVRSEPGGAHQDMLQAACAPRQGLVLSPCAVARRSVRGCCHSLEDNSKSRRPPTRRPRVCACPYLLPRVALVLLFLQKKDVKSVLVPAVSRTRKAAEGNHAWGLATRTRRSEAPCTITLVDVVRVCVRPCPPPGFLQHKRRLCSRIVGNAFLVEYTMH